METHTGVKFQKFLRIDIELRRTGRTDERTNGTEFQGPIPFSLGDQKTKQANFNRPYLGRTGDYFVMQFTGLEPQ